MSGRPSLPTNGTAFSNDRVLPDGTGYTDRDAGLPLLGPDVRTSPAGACTLNMPGVAVESGVQPPIP